MVEITGTHLGTSTDAGQVTDDWRLPALTERQARLEAIANARLKGRSGAEVQTLRQVGEGDIPGQKIYEVVTVSSR